MVIRASADTVYGLVADPTQYPRWSPETAAVSWSGDGRFRGRNRRRLGRWSTHARVVIDRPPSEFTFVVEVMGGDFTRWSYRIEPGYETGTVVLSEEVTMCVDLGKGVLLFERFFLGVRDRRADLLINLETGLKRIRQIAETTKGGDR